MKTKSVLARRIFLMLVPEAVKTHSYEPVDESEDPEYVKVELERMGVTYNQIIPVLIKAMQEQQMQIEALKNGSERT